VVASLSPEHLLTFAAEVATPCSSPPSSHCSSALARPLILRRCALSARSSRTHVSEHHPRTLRAAASLPGIEGPSLDTPGHLSSAQCYHKSSTLFHCNPQPRTCCIQHCLDQLTVCEQTCRAAGDAAAGAHTEYSSTVCKRCRLCEDASTYQTSTSGVGPAGKVAEGLCSGHSSAVGNRCHLCSDARMYQTITSGVMAGSAGEAAEGVVQPAKVQVGSASRSRRRAITSDSSISCSQKTR